MRILHVIPDLHLSSGGVASVVHGLSQAQAATGLQVTVACLNIHNKGPQYTPAGVCVVSFPLQKTGRFAYSLELRKWLANNVSQFSIVHIHGIWNSANHDAAVAARRARVPYLVAPHGMLDRWSIRKNYAFKWLYWWLWAHRDFTCASAVHLLNLAEKERSPWIRNLPQVIVGNGIASSDCVSIPARDTYRQSIQNLGIVADTPLCLFLSRLHPKKGLHTLLPAWKRGVLGHIPNAHLVIAGTGEPFYKQQLRDIAAKENIGDRVHFVGQLAGASKWQALVDADLFVLPSSQEGFSMAITEAMAARCPVVITEDCNFREVAEVGAGITVPTDDIGGFCEAVVKLLQDPERRAQMGNAGQALVRERYTWETIAREFERVYSEILARRR